MRSFAFLNKLDKLGYAPAKPTQTVVSDGTRGKYATGTEHVEMLSTAAKFYNSQGPDVDKKSYEWVARFYSVDGSTLKRQAKLDRQGKSYKKPGRDAKLSMEEELALVLWNLFMARLRFPATNG